MTLPESLPVLPYGRNLKPGAITYVDQPDGSVDIYVLPRPAWQLWLFAAVIALPIAALFTYSYLYGHINTGGVVAPRWVFAFLIPGVSFLGPACVLAMFIHHFGRQSCYIHAGRDGLRVFFTDQGDPRHFDAPADQVLDVTFTRRQDGGYNCPGLLFHLQGQKRTLPLFRTKKNLLAMAAAIRRGLKLPS